jgi:hypothetical protein
VRVDLDDFFGLPPQEDLTVDLKRILFNLEDYPDAVCNDGSPAGYFWQKATRETSQDLWIIYLQGGAWCFDKASCEARWAERQPWFQKVPQPSLHFPCKSMFERVTGIVILS